MGVEYKASIAPSWSEDETTTIDFSSRTAGELALVLLWLGNNNAPSAVPTGWSLLQSHAYHYLYAKVLAAGDIGNVSWGNSSQQWVQAMAVIYSGHDLVNPITASAKGTYAEAAGTSIDCGSLSVTDKVVVALAGHYDGGAVTFGGSPAMTNRLDRTGVFGQVAADTGSAITGTTSVSATTARSAQGRGGFLVAIAAAAGISIPLLNHLLLGD